MIALLTIDFDETVTVRDTTPCLHELAAQRLPSPEADELRQRWRVGAKAYEENWRAVYREAFAHLTVSEGPFRALEAFTKAFSDVEREAIASVVAGGFLRGIPRAALREAGASAEKREGALETLAEAHQRGIALGVVSANWSRDLVRGGLGDLEALIRSNDCVFDEREVSTGALHCEVVSAHDKLRHFRALPSCRGQRFFVGDSVTDLLALLEADVGILIGENPLPVAVCQRVGVEVVPLTPDATPNGRRLFRAASWEDIARFLFR